MASLAIALTTCCFFLCSLATPCLDDEVAMFQSDVRMLSTASTDVKSMQEDIAVSAEKLADIEEKLVNLTKVVEYIGGTLESEPEWMKRATLMSFQFIVPMMEALDKLVVKADHDMSNMSFDWVETAFSGEGSSNDWLHTVSSIVSGSNMLKKVAGKKHNNKLLTAGVTLADAAVNGVHELGDGAKWVAGDVMQKTLKNIAERLTEAAEGVEAATQFLGTTLTSMAEQAAMSAKIQKSVAKFPDSLNKLGEDSLHAFTHFAEEFETKFDDLPATKKHRVTSAVMAVKKTQRTVHVAKALFSRMAKAYPFPR